MGKIINKKASMESEERWKKKREKSRSLAPLKRKRKKTKKIYPGRRSFSTGGRADEKKEQMDGANKRHIKCSWVLRHNIGGQRNKGGTLGIPILVVR